MRERHSTKDHSTCDISALMSESLHEARHFDASIKQKMSNCINVAMHLYQNFVCYKTLRKYIELNVSYFFLFLH